MFSPGEIQSRGMISEAADVASRSIVGVDPRPALFIGFAVAFVLLFISLTFVYGYDPIGTSKINDDGCFVNSSGVPINEPIYGKDSRGNSTIIGVKNCVRPTPKALLYFFAVFGSIGLGAMVGSFVYKVMFTIANPKLSAGIAATGMFRSALTGQ